MYVVVVCVLGELSNMRHLSGSKEVTTGIQGGGSVLTGTKKVNDRKGLFLPSENPSLSYFTYICFRIWNLWVLCSYLSDCLSWDDVEYLCVLPLLPFCQWKEERGNLISDPIGFERFLESPPTTPKMSKSLALSRGKDLCSFVCDLHLPGPPWTQGQG